MLEQPDISEELIGTQLQAEYGLDRCQVSFLPLGYDLNTAVYRVEAADGKEYFLKLRKGSFDPLAVVVPQFLSSLGIREVLSPIPTVQGQLFGELQSDLACCRMILYPYIHGTDGYASKLESSHWVQLGKAFHSIHSSQLPANLESALPRETYNPAWREEVKRFQALVEGQTFTDPVAERLAHFMRSQREVISRLVQRADELARALRQAAPPVVLCHADAHPGNFLITAGGQLYLVDWDNPILAPRERDLMFFGSGMSGDQPGGQEESWFYQGYGPVKINLQALVYYRFERIIQDIAEFCKQLLLTSAGGDDREQAYGFFTSSFLPGHVIDAALKIDKLLAVSN